MAAFMGWGRFEGGLNDLLVEKAGKFETNKLTRDQSRFNVFNPNENNQSDVSQTFWCRFSSSKFSKKV